MMDEALFEHSFWLQIMGDHSRFIFYSLAPTESEYIVLAQEFIILYDQLLEQVRNKMSDTDWNNFNKKVYETTYRFREYKLELLSMSLTSDLKVHLPPSFFNDMLNELEEYLFILSSIMNGQNPSLNPLHYHMLWLTDAVGHAASVAAELDFVEKDLINRAKQFEIQFQDQNIKAQIMNGFLRTQLSNFPALDRFNEQVSIAITAFMDFLEHLRDQRMDGKVLGTLMPLMADHMAREECYYLCKLSQTADIILRPDCDPGRPRVET
jgi:hypothetical protein